MDQVKQIVVAVDFSPCSIDALREALRLASWNRANLTVLHVIEPIAYTPEVAMYVPTPAQLAKDARAKWTKLGEQIPQAKNLPLSIVIGLSCASILSETARLKPDLLVLGEHSTRDASRGIGHVAAGCVQRAGCKVLLVKDGASGGFKRVLVALDFTPTCRDALNAAVRIASQDQAALELFHAYADPWGGGEVPTSVLNALPDVREKIRQSMVARMREFTTHAQHELNSLKATFTATPSHRHGAAIIDRVRESRCDLLVIGTRARWNVRDAFLGSTAERVVRAAPCSLLAIKPIGFEQAASPILPQAELVDAWPSIVHQRI